MIIKAVEENKNVSNLLVNHYNFINNTFPVPICDEYNLYILEMILNAMCVVNIIKDIF